MRSLLCGALLLMSSSLSAQSRFEALKQDTIPEVAGLRVITVRDTLLNSCYTVFMMDPAAPADVGALLPPIDDARQESIQRLRDAGARHDRQVGELQTQFENKTGLTPEMARIPGLAVAKNVSLGDYLARYEVARMRVDGEYESVLRAEIPSSFPAASATPGMRTGAWEDAAEATRRAVANPDPGTMKTFTDLRLSEGPRLAATGPVPCGPAKPDAPKESPRR
jgi:hypothetical protein